LRSGQAIGRFRQIMIPTSTVRSFRRRLLNWYDKHGRDLPWRRTQDPYAILVSEFMLQQTQVASVLPYYNKWLKRFPNFDALARASENDVLHAWQGLGYYARARNLHAAAKNISIKYRGQCPRERDQLLSLPGVGRYTANAIASFAFDQPVPVVDANIARLLARLFNISAPIDSAAGRNSVWNSAAHLVGQGGAGVFNSALMDLGAITCIPRAPKCGICPVKKFCRAKNPARLPIKKARPPLKQILETHGFIVRQKRILLEQSAKRWRGMWILPPSSSPKGKRAIHESIFPFTNHRVTLRIVAQSPPTMAKRQQRWIDIDSLDSIPIPSPHRRAIADVFTAARVAQLRQPPSSGS
jgi:A/G-specific adenine glycosylase